MMFLSIPPRKGQSAAVFIILVSRLTERTTRSEPAVFSFCSAPLHGPSGTPIHSKQGRQLQDRAHNETFPLSHRSMSSSVRSNQASAPDAGKHRAPDHPTRLHKIYTKFATH